MSRVRSLLRPAPLILLGIVVAGLAVRVINNRYGLPYVFTHDEAEHFTDRAVRMFRMDFDPSYYENPTTFTYLRLRGAERPVRRGALLGSVFDLPRGNLTSQFGTDPTNVWIGARTFTALVCMAGVVALYFVGKKLFGRREGLVAAAILSFAFLAVTYSRQAVTDVGALTGVALALLFAVKALEDGGRRWFALAGAAAGLALSFKYTAGLVLLPVGLAALLRLRGEPLRTVLSGLLALACAGGHLRGAEPVPDHPVRRVPGQGPGPGRGGGQPGQGRPGGQRAVLLPRQPHLGTGLAGGAGRHRRRGGAGPARLAPRAAAGRLPGGAVRLPEPAVALLRPLAAPRLPGAGPAGLGGAGAGGRLADPVSGRAWRRWPWPP